jgi:hypothetical protein
MLLDDLSGADILVRPSPNANHIAWQLGHLIAAESRLLGRLPGVAPPVLPDGFADRHNASASHQDSSLGFMRKAEYLEQYNKVREATLTALSQLPDADLDSPNAGPIAPIAPTIGALFLLLANHAMMHSGQFSVVRRTLCKPNAL